MATVKETIQVGKHIIEFLPNSHQYRLDGRRLISVTGALSVLDKPALIPWAVNCACNSLLETLESRAIDKEDIEQARNEWRRVKQEAADIGTLVHTWAEGWIWAKANGEPEPALPEDEAVLNGVLGFLRWNRDNNIKYLEVERVVYNADPEYVGRFDALIEWKGQIYLVDFKTSKGFYPEQAYQTAAYVKAYEAETGKKPLRLIARFDKVSGEFETKELAVDLLEDYLIFTAALTIKCLCSSKNSKA